MKNTMFNIEEPESNEDKDKASPETIGASSFQSVCKGLVNLTGKAIGNGNGSLYFNVHNLSNYYGNNPKPLVPSDEQPWEESSGAKLLKHDQLDSANIKGSLLTKSSPSTPSSSSISTRSNKRAVLCGVTHGQELRRESDARDMKDLLVQNFNFPNHCIRVLTEDEESLNLIPTKRNILESLKWLVKDCQPGDSLVFYFSGTVLEEKVFSGTYVSFSEGLCPTDCWKEGLISKDVIESTIIWPLKKDVTLHVIIDAAHSGNFLNLKYEYEPKRYPPKVIQIGFIAMLQYNKPGQIAHSTSGDWNMKNYYKRSINRQSTSGGLVICLGAFRDYRIPLDFRVQPWCRFPKRTEGVLTFLLRHNHGIPYGRLLSKMHEEIMHSYRYQYGSLSRNMFHDNVLQDPILSSSERFDVHTRIFKM